MKGVVVNPFGSFKLHFNYGLISKRHRETFYDIDLALSWEITVNKITENMEC